MRWTQQFLTKLKKMDSGIFDREKRSGSGPKNGKVVVIVVVVVVVLVLVSLGHFQNEG